MEAIESVADTDHVLVMMDIGSALLSAENRAELLDPGIAAKVRLCAAPLVEGTLAATVSAAGADIDRVIRDAMNASTPNVSATGFTFAIRSENPHLLHCLPMQMPVLLKSFFRMNMIIILNTDLWKH